MNKYEQMAVDILEKVGGEENVINAAHCMTRLRLNLKDQTAANVDEIKAIANVLGCQNLGGQLQIIIGPGAVDKVYEHFCKYSGVAVKPGIAENLDGGETEKEPFKFNELKSWTDFGNRLLDGIVGCLTPALPVLIVAGLIKMIAALIGPAMFGVVTEQADVYRILSLAGDAGFYYLPVFIGYTGAKKFGCNPILGMLMGVILLHPSFLEIVGSGEAFTVFGIPMAGASYSSTVLPMIMVTFAMSYVEKFIRKISPEALSTMLVPTLTILIMLPISLCILGPLGSIAGIYLSKVLIWIHTVTGPFGVALIGALFLLVVASGMHLTLIAVALTSVGTLGFDDTILVGSVCGTYACIAIGLAVLIKTKSKETRQIAFSTTVSQAFGGVGEPLMYGIIFRYKRLIAVQMISTFIAGLWIGFTHTAIYFLGASNILVASEFGKDIVNGVIGCAIAFIVAFATVMIFGFGEEKEQ